MISLRKHLDALARPASRPGSSVLAEYRASLETMGHCGERAVPGLGSGLSDQLLALQSALTEAAGPAQVAETGAKVREYLSHWADRARQHSEESDRALHEVIQVVTKATESTGSRDEKYQSELGELTGQLRKLAAMDSIPLMRRSILESAQALSVCVDRMVADSRESVNRLKGEVAEYRKRLEDSERQASLDPLTGLVNRRGFEKQISKGIESGGALCLVMIDLNEFKSVNDRFGHIAGDDLLRQFAAELRTQFRSTEVVARWGGDEFAAIFPGSLEDAEARVSGIHDWIAGEYKITDGEKISKVEVDASLGVVAWDGQESVQELVVRADKCMYRHKERVKAGT